MYNGECISPGELMSEEHNKKLWVEKYRPKTIDEYIFHDKTMKAAVSKMIAERTIPHLLLSGVQGTGKTTLSQILVRELELEETDILVINGSDENSVDDMRTKIKNFVTTYAIGDFKIVRIEEADYLSLNAQAVLRNMLEEFADMARFIFTCNYENRIKPAIKSRCQHFRFKAGDKVDVTEYACKILMSEHVKFDVDTLDKFVAVGYPDVRKIVNLLQQHTVDDVLLYPNEEESGDYKFKLLDFIERDKWLDARLLCCENVVAEEWEGVYRFLYENLNKAPKFKDTDRWEKAIVILADRLYKNGIVADPEINAAAMFIDLSRL
jgi:DNA polymerase III delta prime subunit